MSFRVALFDLDGTVLSTLEDLADSTNAVLAIHKMPARKIDEIRRFLGNGMLYLISHAVPEGTSPEKVEEVLADFKAYYGAHCEVKTKPYDGIPEMLAALRAKEILTAVVSNKGDFAVQKLAERYFKGCFDFAMGEVAGIARKPAPDMVEHVLKNLGASKSEAVYIGDSEVDVLTAQNAGLPCITVTWGFRDRAYLEASGATVLADTVAELQDLLLAP